MGRGGNQLGRIKHILFIDSTVVDGSPICGLGTKHAKIIVFIIPAWEMVPGQAIYTIKGKECGDNNQCRG